MFFLFSGEGPTDLGSCANGGPHCDGKDYEYGPMTEITSQIVYSHHGYSLLETGHFGFVEKSALKSRASLFKSRRKSLGLPGPNRPRETRYFYRNAQALAQIAKEIETELNDTVVAVLFRDSDGTASANRGLWNDKWQSILAGFKGEGFQRGVPMIPNPKSEAWVLCAVKYDYRNCQALETRSGNDASPQSLKSELERYLGNSPGREDLCSMVRDRTINHENITMPSFGKFKTRLREVI